MKFQSLRPSILASTVFALLLPCGCNGGGGAVLYACNSVDTEGYQICTEDNNRASPPPCAGTPINACSTTEVLGRCSVSKGDVTVYYYAAGGKPTAAQAKAVCLKSGTWTAG
jgi:hypothetical protein